MALIDFIKRNRLRLEEDFRDSPLRWKFSPARWLLLKSVIPELQKHVEGDVLDVGCGQMPFRIHLEHRFRSYEGLDCERRSPHTKYLGDAQDMSEIPDDSYDTVISICVLEHLAQPSRAIGEMKRVCRPGGRIVITTPFLARYHEEPHDYFRYTRHALEMFGREHGLEIERIQPNGGLATFVGHQISTVLISLTWGIPLLKWLVFWLNYWFIVRLAYWFDGVVTFGGKMPLGHVCVYRKTPDGELAENGEALG